MKYAYVGCRTTKKRNARGRGLMVYEILPDGKWEEKQCLFTEDNPSYQCLDLEQKYLYSVHGDLTLVSSYQIQEDGTLKHLNTIDIGGKNPVDITVDKENRRVIVATLQAEAFTPSTAILTAAWETSAPSLHTRARKKGWFPPFTSASGTTPGPISLPAHRVGSTATARCGP